jgi:predicted dehydrogenase
MNNIRIGLVGYDSLQEKFVNSLIRHPIIKFVGATNITEENEKIVSNLGISLYRDLETLIESENPNILSVCTPLRTRFDIVEKAVSEKISVVFEEPLTLNAEKIYRLKESLGKTLALPLNDIYYHPIIQDVLSYIYENEIGLPISILYKRFVQTTETFSLLHLLTGVIHFARKAFNTEVTDAYSFFTKEKNFGTINLIFNNGTIANINIGKISILNNEMERDEVFMDIIGTDGVIISKLSENIILLQTKNKIEKINWEKDSVSNFVKLFIRFILGSKDYENKLLKIEDELMLCETIKIVLRDIKEFESFI